MDNDYNSGAINMYEVVFIRRCGTVRRNPMTRGFNLPDAYEYGSGEKEIHLCTLFTLFESAPGLVQQSPPLGQGGTISIELAADFTKISP